MVLFLVCASAGAEAAIAVAAPPTIMPRRDTVNSMLSANVPAPLHPVQTPVRPPDAIPVASDGVCWPRHRWLTCPLRNARKPIWSRAKTSWVKCELVERARPFTKLLDPDQKREPDLLLIHMIL